MNYTYRPSWGWDHWNPTKPRSKHRDARIARFNARHKAR